jgi:hypothetical protein
VVSRVAAVALIAAIAWASSCRAEDVCIGATDAEAALRLGLRYDTGVGAAQDFARALDCYRKAALEGSREAEFNLAALYDNGRGVARDPGQAAIWYEKAADQGDGRAAYALGLIYASGDGVTPDHATALKWFRLALDRGVAAARGKIATLEHGSGSTTGGPPPPPAGPNRASGLHEFSDAGGRRCRVLEHLVVVDGSPALAYGTICLEKNGRWVLVPRGAAAP